MAFIGLVFAQIVLTLLIIDLILTLTFFILAIVFKIFGKKRKSRKMKIAGNVFLVPGIIFAIPLLAVSGYLIFNMTFKEVEVTLPDGETKYVTKWVTFLQVFMDHGFSSDRWLLLVEEAPSNYSFSDEYYAEKTKDSNYDRLMEIIGK